MTRCGIPAVPRALKSRPASLVNLVEVTVSRQRAWHIHSRAHLRPILYHQGNRQGYRPGPEHLLRHCARARRRDSLSQQSGRRRGDVCRAPAGWWQNGVHRSRCRSPTAMNMPAMKPVVLPVLLIEDEPAVMAYVRAALERSGYTVVCTESGAEGLRLARNRGISGCGLRYADPRWRGWRRRPCLGSKVSSGASRANGFHHWRYRQRRNRRHSA